MNGSPGRFSRHAVRLTSPLTGWRPVRAGGTIALARLLEHLNNIELAAMNDPKGAAGRFEACSSTAKKTEALSKLSTAAARARKALDAHLKDDPATAFYYLGLLFGGKFPAR